MGLSEEDKEKKLKELFEGKDDFDYFEEIIKENPEILEIRYSNFLESDPTLFLMAVKRLQHNLVRSLLELDKEKTDNRVIDQVNSRGHNALRIAIIQNNLKMVELLTEPQYKINLNCKDNDLGYTPLLYMAGGAINKKILSHILLQKEIDKEAVDNRGNNALHLAMEGANADSTQNNLDKIKKLIEAGVRLDQKNNDGHTPFIQALKAQKNDIVRYFVESFPEKTTQKLENELSHLQRKSYRGLGIGLASATIFIPSMLVVPFNEMLKSAVSKLFKSSKAGLFLNTFISGVCATMLVGGTVLYMRDKEKDGTKIKELKTDLAAIDKMVNAR